MHRQRFGYAAVFGWSPPGHEQGGGAEPPLAAAWAGADARRPVRRPPCVRTGDNPRPGGCGRLRIASR
jgi:hypothetical protein